MGPEENDFPVRSRLCRRGRDPASPSANAHLAAQLGPEKSQGQLHIRGSQFRGNDGSICRCSTPWQARELLPTCSESINHELHGRALRYRYAESVITLKPPFLVNNLLLEFPRDCLFRTLQRHICDCMATMAQDLGVEKDASHNEHREISPDNAEHENVMGTTRLNDGEAILLVPAPSSDPRGTCCIATFSSRERRV